MDTAEIARRRLHNLGLAGPGRVDAAEVVGWLGAVQAQDYGPTKWTLGQRCTGLHDAAVDAAFNAGAILRTHVLRPTWHFVLPADIRWILAATAPRVHALNAYMYRQQELDDVTLGRSGDLIGGALREGGALTRQDLAAVLERGGVTAASQRLAYVLMHAELTGLICSGPLHGKQHTYALLDERAPRAAVPGREEAVAELTLRYFTSHGPATVRDFASWSSLTLGEIRRSLEAVRGALEQESVDGTTYWFVPRPTVPAAVRPTVRLLWGYDEYIVGYTESKYLLDVSGVARAGTQQRTVFIGIVLLDTQVAGHWRRTLSRGSVLIEAALYVDLDEAQRDALQEAVSRHAAFLGLAAELVTTSL